MENMKLEPLAGPALPQAVATLAGGATPGKLMAVRGMAPLRPADLLIAVYQLSFDADAAVKTAAEAAVGSLPDKIVLGALGEALPPQVLHFFAERLQPTRRQAIEKILYNRATADETFVHLGKNLEEGALEIIFQNEVRLLRCSALVEALYFNKKARMSSVSRALELCARNNVRLDGIPAFAEMAAEIMADPNVVAPSVPDETFAVVLASPDPATPEQLESALPDGKERVAQVAVADGAHKGGTTFIKFDELKIFEKIRLATIGNANCRQVLIRDSNRVVAMAAARSPAITDMEIIAAASSRTVCDEVIRFIANSREHTRVYGAKLALVNNPKCPLVASRRLLNFLRLDDLKTIARSRNIPSALASAAKKLVETRDKSSAS